MSDEVQGYYICVDDGICPWTNEAHQNVQVRSYGRYSESSVLAGEGFDRIVERFDVSDHGNLKDTIDFAQSEYPKAKYEGEQQGVPIQNHKMSDIAPGWFDPADIGEDW